MSLVDKVCRLCLRENLPVYSVFSENLMQTDMYTKIRKYLYLDIKTTDKSTQSMCTDCIKKVEDIHSFCLEVEQNQENISKLQFITRYEVDVVENSTNSNSPGEIVNVHPYDDYGLHVEHVSYSSPMLNDLDFNSGTIIQTGKESAEYEIVVIPPSDAQNDFNDADSSDNSSIPSSDENEQAENDYDSSDEGYNSIEGFPTVLIQDAKFVIRGRELFQLMSKFYKLQCEICQEKDSVFIRLSSLLEHYEDFHSIKGFVKCCGTKLTKTRSMALHMARHVQPDAFKCPKCGKMMTCPKILRYHIQNHLPEEERPLACSKCPRRFSYSSALTAHTISHQPEDQRDTHICDECGKCFRTAARLTTHISIAHSDNARRYVCHECGRQFTCKGNLTYHLTTHEQIHQVQCTICQKWLKNKLCLRKHMSQHSAARHQCTSCNYSSVNLQCFRNHIRVQHSSDKPHVCTECGRSFKLKNTLLNHLVQHTGERKYSCEFCTKRFASSGNYYTHRKRMHPNELAEYNQKRAKEKEKARESALKHVRQEPND